MNLHGNQGSSNNESFHFTFTPTETTLTFKDFAFSALPLSHFSMLMTCN